MRFLIYICVAFCFQSCISALDISHTYSGAPQWSRKTCNKYLPKDEERLTYSHVLDLGDTIFVYPEVGYSEFTTGLFVPIFPNFNPIVRGWHTLYFEVELACTDCVLNLRKVKIQNNEHIPIYPTSIDVNHKGRYCFNFQRSTEETKEFIVTFEELLIKGEYVHVPPLHLKRKRGMVYNPFSLGFRGI